jgi:hypothetical protein
MSKRGSKSKYVVDTSQLAVLYEQHHRKIFDNLRIRVYKGIIPDFLEFEKVLRDRGIAYKDYTETVLKLLKKWADDKGMDFVPIHTFLSAFALGRYLSVIDSQTVEVMDDDAAVLLHSEVMVGRHYIEKYIEMGGEYRFRDAVKEIKPLLSLSWLRNYDEGLFRPIDDAVDVIAQEHGLKGVMTYADIVDELI